LSIHQGHGKYDLSHINHGHNSIRIYTNINLLMINFPSISPKIRRSLFIIDLASLVVSIWFNIMEPELQKLPSTLTYILLFTTAITPFIAFLPVDRSLWLKRMYIILALVIITIADHYRLFTDNLNFIFLFKGCFLLPRWEIVSIAIMSLLASMTSFVIRAPEIFEQNRQRDLDVYLDLSRIIPNWIISYIGVCIFVLVLGNVWVEEQKSRQRADLLTQQVENLAVDLERNRIARDIHDTLGHSLTSLDVQIELAQRLQATEPERAQVSIDIAKQLSSQALDNVRQALATIKRSNFDLTEAILALAEQNQPFQMQVVLQFPQLSLQSSYQLYCIVQESLTNIQKHAQADRVTITGSIMNSGTILEICDNGKGFNLDRPHAGFGLRNMKERVQCLGGDFSLDSEIGQGTQIKIFIPA
jgi:signal transduction histidine kinase